MASSAARTRFAEDFKVASAEKPVKNKLRLDQFGEVSIKRFSSASFGNFQQHIVLLSASDATEAGVQALGQLGFSRTVGNNYEGNGCSAINKRLSASSDFDTARVLQEQLKIQIPAVALASNVKGFGAAKP